MAGPACNLLLLCWLSGCSLRPRRLSSRAGGSYPAASVGVHGRDASRRNADLMGFYVRTSDRNGHPAFTAVDGKGNILQFIPKIKRWVIARMGEQASNMCSAYTEVVSVEESLYGPPEI